MKRFLFGTLLLVSALITPLDARADQDDIDEILIVPGDSPAFHNTMQIREFMINANQLEVAAYLAAVLEKKRYYSMGMKTFWNNPREEEGFTYFRGDVYIREDLVQLTRKLDMMNSTSTSDFSAAALYMNVVIHEMYHLKDYQTTPISSENETYYRSFLAYRDILLNYLLKNYEIHSSIGSPDAAIWLDRVKAYAQRIHGELATYSLDKYGETGNIPRLFTHDGCVRPSLTREEFAMYSLQFGMMINASRTYEENMKAFDSWARYTFPVFGNPRCIDKAPRSIPCPRAFPSVLAAQDFASAFSRSIVSKRKTTFASSKRTPPPSAPTSTSRFFKKTRPLIPPFFRASSIKSATSGSGTRKAKSFLEGRSSVFL